MRIEDYNHDFTVSSGLEVAFPKEIFVEKNTEEKNDDFDNFGKLLSDLNKQVTEVDVNVGNIMALKLEIDKRAKELEVEKQALEDSRFAFDQQMKLERQKLEDMKIDFEQEKNNAINAIQAERDLLEKNKIAFEKHRSEQLVLIEQSKKMLTKNYKQFESIVSSFNEKIDRIGTE